MSTFTLSCVRIAPIGVRAGCAACRPTLTVDEAGWGRVPASVPLASGQSATCPISPPPSGVENAGWRLPGIFGRVVRSFASVAGMSSGPVNPYAVGFTVRMDWPDRSHDLVGFHASPGAAQRLAARISDFWHAEPMKPACSPVEVSHRDWMLHRRRHSCRSPDCPRADGDRGC